MSVQFSRAARSNASSATSLCCMGVSRTKTPAQMLAELQALYDLGWRRSVFMVDDNFIGNKRNVTLLRELAPWMAAHGYPFRLATEASVDLAQGSGTADGRCQLQRRLLGIETPDTDSWL